MYLFLRHAYVTRALTQLHIKGILGIGHDIDTNLSPWNAKCLAGVTRLTWRASRCTTLVVATVTFATSGRENLNNSAVYRRTYNDARAHTPRLWPLLTASWRSSEDVKRGKEKGREREGKKGKRQKERNFRVRFRVPWKWTCFFSTRRLSRRVLYGDRLRAANGTETRSNATARRTVRIEIWSRGEWCYGSILYKWYVNVILFGRLEKDRSREFIIPCWCFRVEIFYLSESFAQLCNTFAVRRDLSRHEIIIVYS